MLLTLLLGGPVLPAWAMPCCDGAATKAAPAATQEDAMEAMPSCHHVAANGTATVQNASSMTHCAHSTCILQQGSLAPATQQTTLSTDAATPPLAESHLPLLIAGYAVPPRALHPPSPPRAMLQPLRV
ncbi:hypothetical protein [Terriglobus roseus]|uniref:hypothetical protein n=1 Tax=Terriglobus roseus TaxID=392734 RepID=UPI001BAFC8EF|nr:hypothetical protein [Terriglobus roseus]